MHSGKKPKHFSNSKSFFFFNGTPRKGTKAKNVPFKEPRSDTLYIIHTFSPVHCVKTFQSVSALSQFNCRDRKVSLFESLQDRTCKRFPCLMKDAVTPSLEAHRFGCAAKKIAFEDRRTKQSGNFTLQPSSVTLQVIKGAAYSHT